MPRLPFGERADLSQWTAQGMRASATGAVDFSGLAVEAIQIIGGDGDYERQPAFSGGAWRFAAVHLGGMERLFDLLRAHLRSTGRGGNPHQAARLAEAAIAVETARLWVERAASVAEAPSDATGADRIVAYVNLVRLAVERAGLDLMQLVHRSVGLQAFVRPNPIERVSRDLATYLRQPGPDHALTSAAAWILAQTTRPRGPVAMTRWRTPRGGSWLPVSTLGSASEGGFVVVAPHPDDESLACGGLIAKACAENRPMRVVIVSDGAGSHPNSKACPPDRMRALREEETQAGGRGAWARTG